MPGGDRHHVVYSYGPAPDRTAPEVSLETQERYCRRWAQDNSWCIVEYIRDTACGSATNPAGLQRLGELLNDRKVDVVLAYSPAEVFKSQDQHQQLLSELDEAGVSLEFVVDHFEIKDTRYP